MVAVVLTLALATPYTPVYTEENWEAARSENFFWPAALPGWRPPPPPDDSMSCLPDVLGPNPDRTVAQALDAHFEAFFERPEKPSVPCHHEEPSCCLLPKLEEPLYRCGGDPVAAVPLGYLRIGGASWNSGPVPPERRTTVGDVVMALVAGALAVTLGAAMHRNRRRPPAGVAERVVW